MKKQLTVAVLCLALVLGIAAVALGTTVVFPRIRPVTDPIVMQTTATTGAGTIIDLHHRLAYTNVWVLWNGTCTDGVVEVQVALTDAGPWRTVATLDHATDGVNKANAADWILLVGSPGAIRANITTTVVGGTVSAWVTGW